MLHSGHLLVTLGAQMRPNAAFGPFREDSEISCFFDTLFFRKMIEHDLPNEKAPSNFWTLFFDMFRKIFLKLPQTLKKLKNH